MAIMDVSAGEQPAPFPPLELGIQREGRETMNYLYWRSKFEHLKLKGDLVGLVEHTTFYTKAHHLKSVDFLGLYKGQLSVCSGLASVQCKIHQEAMVWLLQCMQPAEASWIFLLWWKLSSWTALKAKPLIKVRIVGTPTLLILSTY